MWCVLCDGVSVCGPCLISLSSVSPSHSLYLIFSGGGDIVCVCVCQWHVQSYIIQQTPANAYRSNIYGGVRYCWRREERHYITMLFPAVATALVMAAAWKLSSQRHLACLASIGLLSGVKMASYVDWKAHRRAESCSLTISSSLSSPLLTSSCTPAKRKRKGKWLSGGWLPLLRKQLLSPLAAASPLLKQKATTLYLSSLEKKICRKQLLPCPYSPAGCLCSLHPRRQLL